MLPDHYPLAIRVHDGVYMETHGKRMKAWHYPCLENGGSICNNELV